MVSAVVGGVRIVRLKKYAVPCEQRYSVNNNSKNSCVTAKKCRCELKL